MAASCAIAPLFARASGDEVTAELIDGPRSVAWQEVENRLHAQCGLGRFTFCRVKSCKLLSRVG